MALENNPENNDHPVYNISSIYYYFSTMRFAFGGKEADLVVSIGLTAVDVEYLLSKLIEMAVFPCHCSLKELH